jgi:hypothetical protein
MATTTNFGWETPDDTDLVKDGAAAMRTLGNSIDTSFVDLKGGTTGQVLAKASGTDLDFSWVAQDDSNAIQNAIVDAKGDLIGATAADTPARLAVGTNGQVLTADSTEATGLKWATPVSTVTYSGCSTTKTTNQSINNGTLTAVTFQTEQFDTDTFHSTSTNTSRFTVPTGKNGKYQFNGTIWFANNGSGHRYIAIYKNGADLTYSGAQQQAVASGPERAGLGFTVVLDLVATDYVEVFALQASGGALDLTGDIYNKCAVQFSYLGA